MIERIKSEHTDKLCKAIASIKTVDEAYRFLDDLCTLTEMLREGVTYNEIAALTGLSTATITRVNRALRFGSDGYHMVLERIQR